MWTGWSLRPCWLETFRVPWSSVSTTTEWQTASSWQSPEEPTSWRKPRGSISPKQTARSPRWLLEGGKKRSWESLLIKESLLFTMEVRVCPAADQRRGHERLARHPEDVRSAELEGGYGCRHDLRSARGVLFPLRWGVTRQFLLWTYPSFTTFFYASVCQTFSAADWRQQRIRSSILRPVCATSVRVTWRSWCPAGAELRMDTALFPCRFVDFFLTHAASWMRRHQNGRLPVGVGDIDFEFYRNILRYYFW